jgi:hypothetical protein
MGTIRGNTHTQTARWSHKLPNKNLSPKTEGIHRQIVRHREKDTDRQQGDLISFRKGRTDRQIGTGGCTDTDKYTGSKVISLASFYFSEYGK